MIEIVEKRTEMFDCRISRLGTHRTLQPAYGEAGFLQAERDQIKEIDKLAEHDALRRRVL